MEQMWNCPACGGVAIKPACEGARCTVCSWHEDDGVPGPGEPVTIDHAAVATMTAFDGLQDKVDAAMGNAIGLAIGDKVRRMIEMGLPECAVGPVTLGPIDGDRLTMAMSVMVPGQADVIHFGMVDGVTIGMGVHDDLLGEGERFNQGIAVTMAAAFEPGFLETMARMREALRPLSYHVLIRGERVVDRWRSGRAMPKRADRRRKVGHAEPRWREMRKARMAAMECFPYANKHRPWNRRGQRRRAAGDSAYHFTMTSDGLVLRG